MSGRDTFRPHESAPARDIALRAVVVVPARDEQVRIEACLRALADQQGLSAEEYEVVLVLDGCRDATRITAQRVAAELPRLRLAILECDAGGAGYARRIGLDFACERLRAVGRLDGLLASTDADTRVARDWLATQLVLVEGGAQAIGGRIDLDRSEIAALAPAVADARASRADARLASARALDGALMAGESSLHHERVSSVTEHHHFAGASLGLTVRTYLHIGGLPITAALEDEALARALQDAGIRIHRPDCVRVTTSARTQGRASRGLAHDLALADWRARRSFHHEEFTVAQLLERKNASVTVILPAREVADTIGPIIDAINGLRDDGLVDEVVVVDAASRDGTAALAAARGATVLQQDDLLRRFGPARGKGDAMWRALSATTTDIVVFLDADTGDFRLEFVTGLLGPLLTDHAVRFVKGAFRRPYTLGDHVVADGGGRVTELVARPLLNLYASHLAGFDQPLAGECAAYVDLMRCLPFPAGYGVEIANLIDAAALVGIDALAQVDLGQRQNRHQPLRDLSIMAYEVMVAVASRLLPTTPAPAHLIVPPLPGEASLQTRDVSILERPALEAITSYA